MKKNVMKEGGGGSEGIRRGSLRDDKKEIQAKSWSSLLPTAGPSRLPASLVTTEAGTCDLAVDLFVTSEIIQLRTL